MDQINRRDALKWVAAAGVTAVAACKDDGRAAEAPTMAEQADAVLAMEALGSAPWKTLDPFLFCAHHDDAYPAGNDRLGPAASLAGRPIGRDFGGKDGWNMYHGEVVPGFPRHPHRGFETVTVVRRGLIDHADSLGAGARYGEGDVQWLTAGNGINHAEMFPLLARDAENPLELFQIWLNLPAASKRVKPYFSMFWSAEVPRLVFDGSGRTEVTVVAGQLGDRQAPQPPPDSWAARAEADVAIWTIRMAPGAKWTLPAAKPGSSRRLYFFAGQELRVAARDVPARHSVDLRGERAVTLEAGPDGAEMLLLQGRPIGEPVVKYGPFVMNSQEEIRQTIAEYRQTGFGGWPWDRNDPVHPPEQGRFARLVDGRVVRPA